MRIRDGKGLEEMNSVDAICTTIRCILNTLQGSFTRYHLFDTGVIWPWLIHILCNERWSGITLVATRDSFR